MSVSQEVTAVSGHAYGVIGADLHVFAPSGVPLYLLRNWQGPAQTDREWLRALPSRMLNSRRAIVPFTGRVKELDELLKWRESGAAMAVRWLHGPGGQGKTRLAGEFAARSAAEGWQVVSAVQGTEADWARSRSEDLSARDGAGVLLIVDYADRWSRTCTTWLLTNSLLARPGSKVRVLMLARTADGLSALSDVLRENQAAPSFQFLDELPAHSEQRAAMFSAARDGFAACYGIAEAGGIEPPMPLDHADMGLTLAVHIAALTAVDSKANSIRPPASLTGLTIYLLDRERLHWERLAGDAGYELNQGERPISTSPEMMTRVVFAAALTGAQPRELGQEALRLAGLGQDPDQALADHARCYPPAAGSELVLAPLYPDRLAEDFLALTLPGRGDPGYVRDWAATSLRALLAPGPGATPWRSRAIMVLAAAAERWPHVAVNHVAPLLRAEPQLAVDAGGAALASLSSIGSLSDTVLAKVQQCLPAGSHYDLAVGVALIAERLSRRRLARPHLPSERARILHALAGRQTDAGLYDRAAATAEQAVAIRRKLASNPVTKRGGRLVSQFAEYARIDLAHSLTVLSSVRTFLGERQEALALITEAVQIFRECNQARPLSNEPALAVALGNLSLALGAVGKDREAQQAAEEAVALRRRISTRHELIDIPLSRETGVDVIALTDPIGSQRGLSAALGHLSVSQSRAGDRAQALASATEAVALGRGLALSEATRHEPHLATDLNHLGSTLFELGRHDEALAAATESVALFRRIAAANPAAYNGSLAAALQDLGRAQYALGQLRSCLATSQEAVRLLRSLARANARSFAAPLGRALGIIASVLSLQGDHAEALDHANESVAILRDLPDASDRLRHDLAYALMVVGEVTGRREDYRQSCSALTEAIELYRQLGDLDEMTSGHLAQALMDLGGSFLGEDRAEEAIDALKQAAEIFERLTARFPDSYQATLASTYNNLSNALSNAGVGTEAIDAAEKAVAISRRLAHAHPAAHEPYLATFLYALALRHEAAGHADQALDASGESVRIRRRLAIADQSAHEADLADALRQYSDDLSNAGHAEQAIAAIGESAAITGRLAEDDQGTYLPTLAARLSLLGSRCAKAGRNAEALAATRESIELRRSLAERDPAAHDYPLADALSQLGVELYNDGQLQDARDAIEAAVTSYRQLKHADPESVEPDLALALGNLGGIAHALGDHEAGQIATEEALALYRELARTDSKHDEGVERMLGNLSVMLRGAGRTDEAERAAAEMKTRPGSDPGEPPDHPESPAQTGARLHGDGRLSAAEAAFRTAIARDDTDVGAQLGLGNVLRDQGRHAEAEAAYRTAIALDSRHARAYSALGNILGDQGSYDEAVAAYNEAIRLDPSFAIARSNLGGALATMGRHSEAEEAYRAALRIDPDLHVARAGLGFALKGMERYAEAEEAYREAISLDPALPFAYSDLAEVLSAQKKYAEVEPACREALRIDPENLFAHHNLGNSLCYLERYAEAEEAFRVAIRVGPASAYFCNGLGYALQHQQRHLDAELAYRQAIQLDPGLANAHQGLGDVMRALKRYQEAEASYREAIRLQPDFGLAHKGLVELLAELNQTEAVNAALQDAVTKLGLSL